ncbi:Mobile element protein [Thauera aromatica K172]|uniref:Mobile element protein n=1 Tax=Thauera aromatica K172 TaxID=44139 RepID=A0A2R4BMP1_THAAR|nr:Mobile element protein [Thauera aromatica K172]
MTTPVFLTVPTLAEAARWAPEQVVELAQANAATQRQLDAMRLEFQAMKHQLDWFRRQLFGQKSEKRLFEADPHQMHLGELPVPESSPPPPGKDIAAHTRRARATDYARDDEPALFFDETRVPVETIALPNPDAEGLAPDQYEVIGEKTSFRLAQRPGSYVILKYVRPVIKHRDTQVMSCPAAPVGVIEGSRADVSFVAGLITDKFCYHQPLYRQHQRLGDNGIKVSRPWLTQLTHAALSLLEPVFVAQLDSIRASRVKAMDETPIKAGRAGPGKMKGGYFWPVYGERDEICFPYHEGRGGKHIAQTLGTDPPPKGAVLLTDGYGAYERYAEKCGLTHAQCWAHSRRKFFDAQSVEPERAGQALDMIGKLYAVEKHIREAKLVGEARRAHRLAQAKPVVHQFFAWVDAQFESQGLLPSSQLPAHHRHGVCARAPRRPRGVSGRPRGADRHQSPGARPARGADGPSQLALLLDRGRRQIRGHRAKPDRHLPPARHRPLCVPGRCAPACRAAPGRRRGATHPQAVEAALRCQPVAIRSLRNLEVGKDAGQLPLTGE